jgi:hypothetical protein
MNKMPDEMMVWLEPSSGMYDCSNSVYPAHEKYTATSYIRADLHQTAIDRIAALEALVEAAERKDRATPMRHFLHWIADRLVMHGDSENVDFVLSLRDRADKLDAALRALTGEAPHD